jgi:hypothetical protein
MVRLHTDPANEANARDSMALALQEWKGSATAEAMMNLEFSPPEPCTLYPSFPPPALRHTLGRCRPLPPARGFVSCV